MTDESQAKSRGSKKALKMGLNETGKRVIGLRTERGETQAQFASVLDVTQPMISAIEAGEEPSCALYLRLGNLAPYPDNVFFWIQAGVSDKAFASASRDVMKDQVADGKELEAKGDVVLVPPFAEGRWKDQVAGLPSLPLPAKFVPNKVQTYYVGADRTNHSWTRQEPGLDVGDIVFFDTLGTAGAKFKDFEGAVVLADSPGGLFIGQLEALERPGGLTEIVLGPPEMPMANWQAPHVRLVVIDQLKVDIRIGRRRSAGGLTKEQWLSGTSASTSSVSIMGRLVGLLNNPEIPAERYRR